MEQWHVQDRAAAQVAGKSLQSLHRRELPQRCWQSDMPLQQCGPQPPRGGGGLGLENQWGKDTGECGSRQLHEGSLEVRLLWAQLDRHSV